MKLHMLIFFLTYNYDIFSTVIPHSYAVHTYVDFSGRFEVQVDSTRYRR